MSANLTKSKFKIAMECPTKLYYVDKPQYANQIVKDSFLQALADNGRQLGVLAQCYFPGGILVQTNNNHLAVSETQKLLLKKSVTLFEAAIQHEGYFIRTDILIKNDNHLKLIEVKAKSIDQESSKKIEKKDGTISEKWKPDIADVAFQKWVLKQAYPNFHISSFLMLVDKDSICPTDGLNQKFLLEKDKADNPKVIIMNPLSKEDLSTPLLKEIEVDSLIPKIWSERDEDGITFEERFQEFSQLYFHDKKSKPIPKKECGTCQFKTCQEDESKDLLSGFKECWQEALGYTDADFNDPTVLDLWKYSKKNESLKKGLIKLKDFNEADLTIKSNGKPGFSVPERQWLQIEKIKNQDDTPKICKEPLHNEIQSWAYPLHFIDFETTMPPIPFKKGIHPYQGIAFQFSHHILDKQGNVEHKGEYLNTEPGVDPSIDFIRTLKAELETDKGTIFRYSHHENTYLNFILRQLNEMPSPPSDKAELISFIKSIAKSPSKNHGKWIGERCMIDLMELVQRYYYDSLTDGSISIKTIFPAILRRSEFLQKKYSRPIYGSQNGIPSKNFINKQWVIFDKGKLQDPYSLLEPINKEISNEKIKWLFEDEELKGGSAATIAYAKLQYTHMSDHERKELKKALLRYCELDTLAMVMIVEAWIDMLH